MVAKESRRWRKQCNPRGGAGAHTRRTKNEGIIIIGLRWRLAVVVSVTPSFPDPEFPGGKIY